MSMRFLASWVFAVGVALFGCGDDPAAPSQFRLESEHFQFESRGDHATDVEMAEGIALAEVLYARIAALVGSAHTPAQRIRVVLEGDIQSRGSYLDFDGIHLYRYRADHGGYWAVFAHELAHAFGAPWFISHSAWDWPTYRFFDEGFAEFVAAEVDPDRYGFPFFGYPEDVVAGHWLVSDDFVPFPALRTRHEALNERCDLQAYTLRASWIRHLAEAFGIDAVLRVVYPDVEPTPDVVRDLVGASLDELDGDWEEWIRSRYDAHPGAAEVAQAYRDRTTWYQVCEPGVDY